MDLLWPGSLLLLGLVPLMIGIYIWMLRRRRKFAVRYSSLALVRDAIPKHSRLRRHLPFALFLLAVSALVMALARPVDYVDVPSGQATILLTIDVSRSMRQTDIAPTRLEAAKAAALSFIDRQNPNTQIGIIVFSGYAELIQPPTNDRDDLRAAVRSLTTGRRTAIGSGILKSIETIAEIDTSVLPVTGDGSFGSDQAAPPGAFVPSIVVLLTDGVSTTGPLPLESAMHAYERGIRVYTIGFRTEQGSSWFGDPFGGRGDRDPSGGGGGGGGEPRFRRGIDEETLKQIADMTGGEYYAAASAGELQEVFSSLPTHLITRVEELEISVFFAAIGALLAAAAIALALLWNPLP